MADDESESAWQRTYDDSIAEADHHWAEQDRDDSWGAINLRIRPYLVELMLIAGFLAGSIALMRTGNGWLVTAGVVFLVVWVLSVLGLATVVWRGRR